MCSGEVMVGSGFRGLVVALPYLPGKPCALIRKF